MYHDTVPIETRETSTVNSLRKVREQLLTKTVISGRVDQLTNDEAVIHTHDA